MDRNQIAAELLRGCPDESRADHEVIAQALRRGDSVSDILAMREVNDWPETYVWLRSELNAQ